VREKWCWIFFQRHSDDDPERSVPASDFLDSCPPAVLKRAIAVLDSVRDAPPLTFRGGGYWEAMHDMDGFYEVRIDNKNVHYRLFCLLDKKGGRKGLDANAIVIIDGDSKPFGTTLSKRRYDGVKRLGAEYLKREPRSFLVDEDEE
jgi:hypothetical protein